MVLAIFILLKGCQVELSQWIIIFILGILKGVTIILVLSGIVIMPPHPWIITVLT